MNRPTTWRYICSLILISLTCINLQAQEQKKKEDKAPLFSGIAVSADIVGFVMKAVDAKFANMEVGARVNLYDKIFPVAELGIGDCHREGAETGNTFSTTSPYMRFGMDYNFNKKHNGNRMTGGLRYGFSKYNYDLFVAEPLTDPIWGGSEELDLTGRDGRCHWLEVVFGLETRVWTIVHLGWDIRIKAKLSQKKAPEGQTWYIPGYGKTDGSTCWGGSFKLLFDI